MVMRQLHTVARMKYTIALLATESCLCYYSDYLVPDLIHRWIQLIHRWIQLSQKDLRLMLAYLPQVYEREISLPKSS